ncbi:MAG: AraC family transcriptional regulator [Ruminococcaceae bacterium]|nr:AraC family transcriptional regulator [Oscillospiraceae bacterium]
MDFKIQGNYSKMIYRHTRTEIPDQSEFDRHFHPYYELLYVKSGSGKYVVESAEYPLLPNTLLIIRPYEFHYVCPSKDSAYDRYVVHFNKAVLFGSALTSLSFIQTDNRHGKGAYFALEGENPALTAALSNMDSACNIFEGRRRSGEKEETMQTALLSQILLLLSLEEHESRSAGDGDMLGRIIEYLNLNISRDITLDEISQKFFISKYYLCRAFKEHTGVSLVTYLNTKRIAMAEQLIKQGEPSTSVAYQVGFKTYSSFYRSYCKYLGHSPTKSRGE